MLFLSYLVELGVFAYASSRPHLHYTESGKCEWESSSTVFDVSYIGVVYRLWLQLSIANLCLLPFPLTTSPLTLYENRNTTLAAGPHVHRLISRHDATFPVINLSHFHLEVLNANEVK